MVNPRYLKHAPIKEALIDIRVTLSNDLESEALDSKYDCFSDNYPKREVLKLSAINLNFEEGQAVTTPIDQGLNSYRYTSNDEKQIVQFRKDGFTFSRLEPYQTWELMKEEAIQLWNLYVEAAKPNSIIRVATRYINEMRMPLPFTDFKEFMVTPPEIPVSLPQGISSFITRVVMHDPSIDVECILTQAMEGIDNNHAPIVLDIDAFSNKSFEIDSNEYWDYLDKLRDFKNKVFFESITEKTAGLFQ